MEFIIAEPEELEQVAEALIVFAAGRKKMIFQGEIGAGKTTFIQAICKTLGVKTPVTSPSYSLVNEYPFFDAESQRNLPLYHLDLYRLKNLQEALDIGIEEYLYSPYHCFVEWPDLIRQLLPENTVEISLEIIDNSYRKIIFL